MLAEVQSAVNGVFEDLGCVDFAGEMSSVVSPVIDRAPRP